MTYDIQELVRFMSGQMTQPFHRPSAPPCAWHDSGYKIKNTVNVKHNNVTMELYNGTISVADGLLKLYDEDRVEYYKHLFSLALAGEDTGERIDEVFGFCHELHAYGYTFATAYLSEFYLRSFVTKPDIKRAFDLAHEAYGRCTGPIETMQYAKFYMYGIHVKQDIPYAHRILMETCPTPDVLALCVMTSNRHKVTKQLVKLGLKYDFRNGVCANLSYVLRGGRNSLKELDTPGAHIARVLHVEMYNDHGLKLYLRKKCGVCI